MYQAHKVMRIVQPNNIENIKEVEINVPIYNDYGTAIGKWNDYSTAKFDVRIVAGSTLPINRWAYLAELKELMKLGIVDDIAVLAETDIRNKEKIVQRKSLYSQLSSQLEKMITDIESGNAPYDQQQNLTLEFYEKRISKLEERLDEVKNGKH